MHSNIQFRLRSSSYDGSSEETEVADRKTHLAVYYRGIVRRVDVRGTGNLAMDGH